MAERPILFSAPMVRALLEGRKTQTRRVVKSSVIEAIQFAGGGPEGESATVDSITLSYGRHTDDNGDSNPPEWLIASADYPEEGVIPIGQGYGAVGDSLWVRETWCPIYPQDPNYNGGRPIEIDYAATPTERMADHLGVRKWRPSIFMPRALSRITLRITGVRIERLQDISAADAVAEGIAPPESDDEITPVGAYRELWLSINGPGSWETNPWV